MNRHRFGSLFEHDLRANAFRVCREGTRFALFRIVLQPVRPMHRRVFVGRAASPTRGAEIITGYCPASSRRLPFTDESVLGRTMQDMLKHLEKLRRDAAECALIRDLATDIRKRELFTRLADHLTALAAEVEKAIAAAAAGKQGDAV
ncbi:hypothetical protein ACVW17_006259 [Bradyrhizobium sp. USDA 4473]